MENASKALIIAGAILIAILLISVGIVVLNSTSGVTDEAERLGNTMSVQVFNQQFTKYCGTNIRGSTVRDLQNFVGSYNASNDKDVTLDTTQVGNILVNQYYDVTVPDEGGRDNEGYIIKIVVSAHSNTP